VPSKDYKIWLDDRTFIGVELVMVKGRVVSFVVRLMRLEGDHELNIARYDTAHGAPHRDSLGRKKGLLKKQWFPDLPLDIVLRKAILDFRLNHENYVAQFTQN
jgi:hypothetical protein